MSGVSFPRALVLSSGQAEAMRRHLLARLPEEACGLAGGRVEAGVARVTVVTPVENALHSPTRFRMDPAAQLQVFNALDAQGLELVAIFHSHPEGPERPSATDVAEFAYPGVLSLIWSPDGAGGWQVRAFEIAGLNITEVPILTGQQHPS